jgi:hypothetical protein
LPLRGACCVPVASNVSPLMARPMSPEREKEYADLLAFLDFHSKHLVKNHPTGGFDLITEAKRIAEKYGKSKGLEGLRQAVNDVIEELSDLTPDSVKLVDGALRGASLRTLSELRREYGATYRKILRRGSIKTETEYYLMNGFVIDLASEVPHEERKLLQEMVQTYESRG